MKARTILILVVAAVLSAVVLAAGYGDAADAGNTACAAEGCHPERAAEIQASKHAGLSCLACHPDAQDHPAGYSTLVSAAEYFQMEICGACHPDQYGTYTYDDGTATPYGGSALHQPKYQSFPSYNTVVDGHGFVREYNEDRAHTNMMADHVDITRTKFEVCIQCKSTRVAYYWDSGKAAVLQNDVTVSYAPTGETFVVPKGTTIRLGTDVTGSIIGVAHQVVAEVQWGDTLYTSYAKPGGVLDLKHSWVAVYAMSVDGLPAGSPSISNTATCNHCHDPHRTEFRLVRKELIRQVDAGGVNPTAATKTSFADASRQDRVDTLCGQCHVEYVCGRSGVDGIDRDYIPWAKVTQLEDIYRATFPMVDAFGIPAYSMD